MDGEVGRGDGGGGRLLPPAWELFVVHHRLRMKQVEAVVDEAEGEGIMVLFGPGMDVHRIFVHVLALKEKHSQPDENQWDG